MNNYLQNLLLQLDTQSIGNAITRAFAVLLCLSVHETCHGLAALSLGDPTAKQSHRISLNPLQHIDWLGLLLMFAVGFGWAKPVPVDIRHFNKPKRDMAITALAGPLSNFLLAFVCIFISKAICLYIPYTAASVWLFSFFLTSVAPLSIGLFLFNLIPIPPLDGSKVAAAILPDRAYAWQMKNERFGILLLLALSALDLGSNLIRGGISAIYLWMINLVF